MMTIDDCTNVKKQFSIVNMVKRSKSLQHNFEFHLRSSLLQQTNAIQAGLVQALMGKDTIISKLQDENAELLEENKQLVNKIRDLEQETAPGSQADLALRIETLLEEIKLKDDELQRNQETIENFTSSLQNANGKKSIFQKENVKLKAEIMTLKHLKLREDKEFTDTIADLKKQLITETQEDNKDLQIQELKDLVSKKNNDILTIQKTQMVYVEQFKKVEELMKKSLEEKDRIIKSLKVESPSKKLHTRIEELMKKSLEEKEQIKKSLHVESPSEKLNRLKHVSIAKEDRRTQTSKNLQHDLEQEKGRSKLTPIHPLIDPQENTDISQQNKMALEEKDELPENENSGDSSLVKDGAMTSSKKYSQTSIEKLTTEVADSKFLKCPLKSCHSQRKFRKNRGDLRQHIATHFTKEIQEKYPYYQDKKSACLICNGLLKSFPTHNYHYAFVHKQLKNILDIDDPRREEIKQYLL